MLRRMLMLVVAVVAAVPSAAQSPPPWRGENLQYFPKDISRDRLTQRMREFSFALGVRCQYCHAGGDGVSFDGVSFASEQQLDPERFARIHRSAIVQLDRVAHLRAASHGDMVVVLRSGVTLTLSRTWRAGVERLFR
jgi:hypothetical protein